MARLKYQPATMVEALTETKGMVTLAARKVGCDEDTIYRYAKRFPIIQHTITSQRNEMLDVTELRLFSAIQAGEAWAVCFFLKTQGKGRGYVERQEVQHSGDMEIVSDDRYEAIASRLARILITGDDGGTDSVKATNGAHANGSKAT
jgi:hypothetical protein